jgi:hypothetical protein
MNQKTSSARLVSELELVHLAREPKHKKTSYAYLKWNKQNTYELYNGKYVIIHDDDDPSSSVDAVGIGQWRDRVEPWGLLV